MNSPTETSRGVALSVAAVAVLFACACGGQTNATATLTGVPDTVSVIDSGLAYWPAAAWRTTSPVRVGIDEDVLRSITGRLGKGDFSGMHSFFVARHG
ncbi:MAG: hypothetical protein V4550_05080 [Gemmatimonadota bacterium]